MSADPVTTATGMPSARSSESSSVLSSVPRWTSSNTTDGRARPTAASASASVAASLTAKPSSSRLIRTRTRIAASSSTTSALRPRFTAAMLTTTIHLVTARTAANQVYAEELGELWTALVRTLARLDLAAAEPDLLDDDGAEQSLRRLQYSLHVSSEHVVGIVPPSGEETAHAELEAALLAARDATAAVADAVSAWAASGVAPLLHEWRAAP